MPSKKLRFAGIGCQRQGWADISRIGTHPAVEMVAFCDIDRRHFDKVDKAWPGKPKFSDFRKMFDQLGSEIDAVNVSVPDHNHAVITQAALERGLNVYCEKPLTHTVWEARQIAGHAAKAGTVNRMGNQIHSEFQYRVTKLLIQEEKVIGKVKEVHTWISAAGHGRSGLLQPPAIPEKAPPEVDWDQWIGPAPWREFGGENVYHPRCWRDWQAFGSGSIGDNGCHLLDPLFTSMNLTAPLSITAEHSGMNDQVWPAQETLRYVFPGTEFTASETLPVTWYDGGRRPNWKHAGLPPAESLLQPASMLIGEKGYLLVPHWGTPKLYPEKDFARYELPDPGKANHYHDWVDACLEGNAELSDNFAYAGPLSEAVQLGNVAVRFPRQTLEWDAAALRITNVPEANAFLTKEYRDGWAVTAAG
ncbi:MAG: Gfo/Idh/MocA family oxidoreductase [Verrucomicrobiae bacterium]|nr:Gfo/Idh/MocA family oxidoreductase [Verrucomicrobiae bacterium]